MSKEKEKPKTKQYFDCKIEAFLPCTIHYRILAEDAEQALQLSKNMQPVKVEHRLHGRKEIKATVYDGGSTIIRLIKNLVGIIR